MAVRLFETTRHAGAYLRFRVRPDEVIKRVTSFMEERTPKPFNLAVDVGCGSGQGTTLLAPHFTRVVGTDASAAQLEMAVARGSPANVTYRQSLAEDLPFASGEVDLVTAMSAAHWFDHQRFLEEAGRLLRPGGCLALLSYTMDMELEYGDVSSTLNRICQEFYTALYPSRHPHIGMSTSKIYLDMFESCSYPDKEWNECLRARRTLSVNGYIGLLETFSTYQNLRKKDPAEAERLSNDLRNKLFAAMHASSADTDVTVVVKYFYWLACKPSSV